MSAARRRLASQRPPGGRLNDDNDQTGGAGSYPGNYATENSEEPAGMRQDVGAETLWKNRRHTRSGLVRFFQTVYAQEIDADRPFLFRRPGYGV